MIPLVVLAVAAILLTPPIVDSTIGDTMTPTHPLYAVEKFGELEKSAVGLLGHDDKLDERLTEYEDMLMDGVDDQGLLNEADSEAVEVEAEISGENTQAISTAGVDDDMNALAKHRAFQERYRLHLQKMRALKERLPQQAQAGIANAIMRQEMKLDALSNATESMRSNLEARTQTRVQVEMDGGQAVVLLPDNPAVLPAASSEVRPKMLCSIPDEVFDRILADGEIGQDVVDKLSEKAWIHPSLVLKIPIPLITQAVRDGTVPADAIRMLPADAINKIAVECNVPPELAAKLVSGEIQVRGGLRVQQRVLQRACLTTDCGAVTFPTIPITLQTTTTIQHVAACTQEASLCPDGTYVGRTEPNCDFAPCPTTTTLEETTTTTLEETTTTLSGG